VVRAHSTRILSRQNSFVASKTATKQHHRKDLEFCRQKCDSDLNTTEQLRSVAAGQFWWQLAEALRSRKRRTIPLPFRHRHADRIASHAIDQALKHSIASHRCGRGVHSRA
jgi:hypothetical protein